MQELTPEAASRLVRDVGHARGAARARPAGRASCTRSARASASSGSTCSRALLVDVFALFTRPGVTLRSGFYGPVERALRDAGHAVRFVPADFRRFARIARQMAPRVMATAATPPDRDGFCSLSLHAGATVDELLRCGRDPDRVLIVEANPRLPRTLGLPPEHPHAIHIARHRRADPLRARADRAARRDSPPTSSARSPRTRRAFIADDATLQTGIGGMPDAVARILAERSGGDYGVHSRDVHHRAHGAAPRRQGDQPPQGAARRRVDLHVRDGHARALRLARRRRPRARALPARSTTVNDPAMIARNRRAGLDQRRALGRSRSARWSPTRSAAASTRGSAGTRTS